jgi:hypothetical protein
MEKVKLNIVVDRSQRIKLKQLAAHEDKSLSAVIRLLIDKAYGELKIDFSTSLDKTDPGQQ